MWFFMPKKEIDFEKEAKKVSRKYNIKIMRSEYAFDKKIKKLDKEIDNLIREKISEFNNAKNSVKEFTDKEKQHIPTIEEYKKILDEIE